MARLVVPFIVDKGIMCLKLFCLNKKLKELKDQPFDVIVYAGQSNSMGFGVGDEELCYVPDDDILMYYKGRIYTATERKINRKDKRAIFALYFAKKYKEQCLEKGRKIMLIGAAVSGTGFSDHRWGIGEDLYNNLLKMTRTVMSGLPNSRLKCILWHQGEADVEKNAPAEYYESKLMTLIEDYRRQTGINDLPFIAGDFVPEWKQEVVYSDVISKVAEKCVLSIKNGGYVYTDGLKGNPSPDEIHFCRKSLKLLGERYFDTYKRICECRLQVSSK